MARCGVCYPVIERIGMVKWEQIAEPQPLYMKSMVRCTNEAVGKQIEGKFVFERCKEHRRKVKEQSNKKMATYTVFDTDKPAKYPEHKVDPSWDNATYGTFEEALTYAKLWLGAYDVIEDGWDGSLLNYSGYSDGGIEIRKEG